MTDNWDSNWWDPTDSSHTPDLPEDADFHEDISWDGQGFPDMEPIAPEPDGPVTDYVQPNTWDPHEWNRYQSPPARFVHQPNETTPVNQRERHPKSVAVVVTPIAVVVIALVIGTVFAVFSPFNNTVENSAPSISPSWTLWTRADPDLAQSMVQIRAMGDSVDEVTGAGIVVRDGITVTPYHLVAGADSITISAGSGEINTSLLGFDVTRDVAVLRVNLPNKQPINVMADVSINDNISIVDVTESAEFHQMATSVCTTNAQTAETGVFSVFGVISRPSNLIEIYRRLTLEDAMKYPTAMQGAGIFDISKRFVGMSLGLGGPDLDTYAVSAKDINQVVDTVLAGKDKGTVRVGPAGDLGLKLDSSDDLDYPTVESITNYGPAAKTGIAKGDVLLAINGKDVLSNPTLGPEGIIRSLEPGSKAKITIRPAKGASEKTYTLTVAKSNSA